MQIHEYIPFARRWVPIALVLAIVCAGAAYAISKYVVQPVYTATTTMQVDAGGALTTVPTDPIFSSSLAQTDAAVAEQRPIVQAAFRDAAGTGDPAARKRFLRRQSPSASCQANGVTALFSCSVTANTPTFAATAANRVAAAFIHQEKVWQQNPYATVLIVTPASAPTGPSSPHPTLNALVAFFLVFLLVLGFGLAYTGSTRLSPEVASGDRR
jgi:capsular polysaccharide biosynthesis protein